MIIDPHYPNIVLKFPYREAYIEIEQTTWHDVTAYVAWVDYQTGSAVAVPKAWTRADAIQKAKRWVDCRFYDGNFSR
ncbi:MAG: hypothetical protein AAF892_07410 [Cyanobacteria bacterium P01_D01_bin.71]